MLETLFESSEFAFFNYKCIVKAPRVSSKFVWHRDLPYLEHSTPNLITAMLCLDDMTEANGATIVMPGTHQIPREQVTAAALYGDGEKVVLMEPATPSISGCK